MRVLLTSTSGSGHVGPLVPFVESLQHRGDDVCVVAPAVHRARLELLGVPYRIAADPPAQERAEIWDRATKVGGHEAAVLVNREIFGRLDTAASLPAVQAAVEELAPELVLHEAAEFAGVIAAHRAGVPHAQVAIGLAGVEDSSLDLIAPALLAYGDDLVDVVRRSPYLTGLPESLDPSPYPDTRRHRRSAGPCNWSLPRWWQPRLADRPLVYVSFGTIAAGLPVGAAAFRAILAALCDLDVRALVTTGGTRDIAELGTLPEHVHAEPWVDQDGVLAHASLVVGHGGAGTTFGALAAGVPLVLVPLMADQPRNARLVASAGAGIVVSPDAASVTSTQLRAAVEKVLAEPVFAASAATIAAETQALPSLDDTLDDLVRSSQAPA